jgi:signal transduction histidine kinase
MSGRDLMRALRERCPSAVPIILTGHGTIERAVDLMRQGAFDVLTKPCRAVDIASAVAKAHAHHVALQTNSDLRARLRVQDKLAMIGKLAAGVAHELNNPLDAVLRCVRLTRDHLGEESEAREYMDLAESGLRRMADIVRSLLTFSRHAAVEQAPQALASLIQESITAVTLALDTRAPAIETELRPEVALVPVPRGMHQVLVNLLRNACDAAGSTEPVTVRATRVGDELHIEVEDRGPGIPPEVLPRVFEPFFTTKPVGSGTGLGLPITARLVEKFGGRVSLECPHGGGTIASVTLPLARSGIPNPSETR